MRSKFLWLLPFVAVASMVLACGGEATEPDETAIPPDTTQPPTEMAERQCGYPPENTAKLFVCAGGQTANLPFDVITAWSSRRFLDDRLSFVAGFIQMALESNYAEFMQRPDLGADDVILVELAFSADSAVTLDLIGEGSNFVFRTVEAEQSDMSVDVQPSAWVEILAGEPVDGDLGWIEETDFSTDGLGINQAAADAPLTLAAGAPRRVWLPFLLPANLNSAVGELVYTSPAGAERVITIFA